MTVPYTDSTAATQVRVLLNEPTQREFLDSEIVYWLKMAVADVSIKTLCAESTFGIALKDGVMEYNASTTANAAIVNVQETDVTIDDGPPGTLTSAASATWESDGFKHGFRFEITDVTDNLVAAVGQLTILTLNSEVLITVAEGTLVDETQGNADLTYFYQWLADIIKPYACVYHKGKVSDSSMSYRGLTRIHPRMIDHLEPTADGEPYYWWYYNDKIGVYPIPDSAQELDCVLLYHSRVVEDIADLPDMYQSFAILKAVAMARRKAGNFAEAMQYEQMYLNSIMFHRLDLYEKGVDSQDMFQVPDRTQVARG